MKVRTVATCILKVVVFLSVILIVSFTTSYIKERFGIIVYYKAFFLTMTVAAIVCWTMCIYLMKKYREAMSDLQHSYETLKKMTMEYAALNGRKNQLVRKLNANALELQAAKSELESAKSNINWISWMINSTRNKGKSK